MVSCALLKEALYVAIIVSVFGTIVTYFMLLWENSSKIHSSDHWKNIIISFFITGFLVHLTAEYTGVNQWYCNHGYACQAKR
jgi:nucleoside recognition membrane protein YjiH